MKIKNLIFLALISFILAGSLILTLIFVHGKRGISELNNKNQISVSEDYAAASISKGAVLLLIAAGLVGYLGFGRKKKDQNNSRQNYRSKPPQAD
jgi:hypothetical protein